MGRVTSLLLCKITLVLFAMASYVDKLMCNHAVSKCKVINNKRVVSQHDLMVFINTLGMDMDTEWAQRGTRVFRYPIVGKCKVSDGSSPVNSFYELAALPAVLSTLGVPASSFCWDTCQKEIERRLAPAQTDPASTDGSTAVEYASVLAKGLSSSQELIVHDSDSADSAPEDERRLPTGPGDYRGKPQAELLGLLIKRDRDNKVLQTRLRLTQRRVCYYKQRLGKARDSLKRKRDDALGAREFQGEHSCWYTPRGGYLLAARRCLSNCAAYGLGFALMRNIHHTTVSRWEIKLRAAFVAAGRGSPLLLPTSCVSCCKT
jgi:hypothetical protein